MAERNPSADFLSLNAARVTPQFIRAAHSAGKPIHVWTINHPRLALTMIEMGVDNLITDDPVLVAQVVEEWGKLATTEKIALRLRGLILPDELPKAGEL